SSGGILLAQLFKTVETFPVKNLGFNTTQTVHLMAEAEKYAYADRAQWLGDADFFHVPADSLIDEEYLHNRFKDFSATTVIPSEKIHAGSFVLQESEETTHFSIVDAEGNAVAVTTTLNDSYGSRIFVTGAGFILNNEMDDFSAKPGEPNLYGLIGGEANAIEPGKRMLSSMTPTIVEKDGELFMVLGSPGGSTIITSVFQSILNVTEHNMTMQESVNAKRFHHQWLPDEILYEKNAFTDETKKQLTQLGYTLKERSGIGRVDAILIRSDGKLEGAADPRGDDKAMGY
ncbi:MAG: gamma-glutamyltransferase family protein, partial [Chitinophagales bacterium]